jgi:hypothetical protein
MYCIKGSVAWGVGVILAVQPCWGWGEVGHRVVGRVAASLLTPAAQRKVAEILEVDNTKTAVADALAEAAEWPDVVARDEYKQSVPWHFIDLGVKPNPAKDDPRWDDPATAFAKIVKYFGTVKRGDEDELEPGSDLKFLVHLMGDVHQPLHAATNRDRGGNCLFIKFAKEQGGISLKTKFHSAWDKAMLEDRLGTDDRLIARHLVRDWMNLSQSEQTAMTRPTLSGDGSATVRAWIVESHEAAVTQLYATLHPAVSKYESAEVAADCHDAAPGLKSKTWMLDDGATEDASRLMERQMIKAGVRLASMLNAAMK